MKFILFVCAFFTNVQLFSSAIIGDESNILEIASSSENKTPHLIKITYRNDLGIIWSLNGFKYKDNEGSESFKAFLVDQNSERLVTIAGPDASSLFMELESLNSKDNGIFKKKTVTIEPCFSLSCDDNCCGYYES